MLVYTNKNKKYLSLDESLTYYELDFAMIFSFFLGIGVY